MMFGIRDQFSRSVADEISSPENNKLNAIFLSDLDTGVSPESLLATQPNAHGLE